MLDGRPFLTATETVRQTTDDGIVLEIDKREVLKFASVIRANGKLTEMLLLYERRFEELLTVYLVVSKTVREQDVELESRLAREADK